MKNLLKDWKYPLLLLSGVGIANLGAWIYLIALNVLVYNMGGSALAVATLYVIKPLATLFTNAWSGSMIDRLNKRKLMIHLYISCVIYRYFTFTSVTLDCLCIRILYKYGQCNL